MLWQHFIRFDEYNIIRGSAGDGTFTTISIREWFKGEIEGVRKT
jgi:hypothetical protein